MKEQINQFGLTRKLPLEIAREVRQRCGFGCVVCGSGIYQYHHFDPPFSEAKEHLAKGITLLCGKHHDAAEKGIFSHEAVVMANSKPKGKIVPSHIELDFYTPKQIVLGALVLLGQGPVLEIEGETVLSVGFDPAEGLIISGNLYDSGGRHIVKFERNELITAPASWDIELKKNVLKVRQSKGTIVLEVVFISPDIIYVRRLHMICRGWIIDVSGPHGKCVIEPQLDGGRFLFPKDHLTVVGGKVEIIDKAIKLVDGVKILKIPGDVIDSNIMQGKLIDLITPQTAQL